VGLSHPPPPNLALKDLASLVGDDAAREIVRLFLQTFPDSIHSLRSSSRPDQMRVVHGLKSSALHMGAEQLTERITAIEDKLTEPGTTLGAGDVAAAMAEFEAFAVYLRAYAEV
jgi:HPt (histidine-containing phosphotransfer) domain-containing protein